VAFSLLNGTLLSKDRWAGRIRTETSAPTGEKRAGMHAAASVGAAEGAAMEGSDRRGESCRPREGDTCNFKALSYSLTVCEANAFRQNANFNTLTK